MQPDPTPDTVRLLDVCGRLRSPATLPGFHAGRPPATKGRRYPADPIAVEDIAKLLWAIKPASADRRHQLSAQRLRALIVLLWRSGLRISEALALEERDLNRGDYAITVRRGKGDKRRISAMDDWGWHELQAWLDVRQRLPFGAVFCVLSGPTIGQPLSSTDARRQLRELGAAAGLRRRINPHAFRHQHAVELWREGVDVYAIQRQLGHARLDVTAEYLRGIAPLELLEPIGRRRAPTMAVPHAA
jgi:site-specific recombinase XerD